MGKDDRMISSDFGTLIKLHRTNQNLTFKELSELSGISESYLFRLETSERRTPSYKIFLRICNALKINVEELLIATDDISEIKLKPIEFLIITNDFTLNGKKATRKQKEGLVELIDFIFDSKSNIKTYTKSNFEDAYKLVRLAIYIKND